MVHADLSQKVVRPRCGILKKGMKVRVVTSPAGQMMILKSCHLDAAYGHYGLSKMWRRVAERFYWKGTAADTFYFYDTFMTLLKFSKRIVEQILRFIIGTHLGNIIYGGEQILQQYLFWGVQISQNMDLGVHTLGVEILCDRSEVSVR